jgi:hypothetical protein
MSMFEENMWSQLDWAFLGVFGLMAVLLLFGLALLCAAVGWLHGRRRAPR